MKSVEDVLKEFEERIKYYKEPVLCLPRETCQDIISYLSLKPSRKNALRWFRRRIRRFGGMGICALYIRGWELLTGRHLPLTV